MLTFAVHGLPAEAESVSAVTLTNSVTPGETRFFKGEEYIYVANANANTGIGQGCFAVLSANSGFSVTVSSITQYDFPIGVCKHQTIPSGGYGWLLTRGWTPVSLHADNSAAVSDLLYPAANGLFGNCGIAKSAGCGIVLQPIGYVCVAAASGASGGTATAAVAYVRCYGT
jgi:hypothetical protein